MLPSLRKKAQVRGFRHGGEAPRFVDVQLFVCPPRKIRGSIGWAVSLNVSGQIGSEKGGTECKDSLGSNWAPYVYRQ